MEFEAAAPTLFVRLVDHPLRWRLLAQLAQGDLRVRELVERTNEPQNLVSYHLRVLRDGGLVSARRSSYDGRDSYYHLDVDRCADGLARTGAALHPFLRLAPAPAPAANRTTPLTLLFVCTGNSARSPIAEALLRRRAGREVHVSSAGTAPKEQVHPHAVRVLHEEYGVDIAGARTRSVERSLDVIRGRRFDRVVTLCDRAREVLPDDAGRQRTHWSIPDPAASTPGKGSDYRGFLAAAADIDTRVRHLLPTLTNAPASP